MGVFVPSLYTPLVLFYHQLAMTGDFHIIEYPRTRIATIDMGRIALRKHNVAALIEVDVTETRSPMCAGFDASAVPRYPVGSKNSCEVRMKAI